MEENENKNTYCVYMHKNKTNGKVYIGITGNNPQKRWLDGKGYRYNTHFTNSINKYGWNGFTHIILYKNLSKKQACDKEIELIEKYDSTNRDNGYNISLGGQLGHSRKIYAYNRVTGKYIGKFINSIVASDYFGCTSSSICAVAGGSSKYMYDYYFSHIYIGEQLDEDTLLEINYSSKNITHVAMYGLDGKLIKKYFKKADAMKDLFDDSTITFDMNGKTRFGYIWIPFENENELFQQLSQEYVKNAITDKRIGCYQYDLDGNFIKEWYTITEASEQIPCSLSRLAHKCKVIGKYKNYYWARANNPHMKYGEKLDISLVEKRQPNKRFTKVYQYDLCGVFLNEYESIASAARNTGNVNEYGIKSCLQGSTFQSGGYIWSVEKKNFTLDELLNIANKIRKIKVNQFDISGNLINTYSFTELDRKYRNIKLIDIKRACITNNEFDGYIWKYA